MKVLFVLATVAAIATFSGCGGTTVKKLERKSVYPVSGQVLWKSKPVESASVVFHPQDWTVDSGTGNPTAYTGPDGRFKLTTYNKDDGAPAGKYLVTIDKFVPDSQLSGSAGVRPLPAKYAAPNTTPLEIEIKEGPNDLSFTLTGKAAKAGKTTK